MRQTPSLSHEAGYSIIEVLVAATVLIIGIGSTLALLNAANAASTVNRGREAATNLARELTEAARGIAYTRISTNTLPGLLSAQPGLESVGTPPDYKIKRRNFTYTVTLNSCIMDDARDGGGDQTSGGFCSDSVAPNTPGDTLNKPDKNPEDYKRVTANVSWTQGTVTRSVRQTAIVNNPGSAGGPAIRSLALQGFGSPPPQLTLEGGTPGYVAGQKVTVEFTTSSKPQTATWTLDGVPQKPTPTSDSSGTAWSATWDYSGLDDGTYVIGAKAADRFGTSGPGRSLNVILNRFAPRKVKQVAGGRVTLGGASFVELEWAANTERDIVGYRVYRKTGSSDVEVCALQSGTTCRDENAPANGTLEYYVVAYDNDPAGALRAGTPSDDLTVVANNQPPKPVTGLTATPKANGTTVLTWSRPAAPVDPDTGDTIDFYRVYRDGFAVKDRVVRWYDGAATVTWTDTSPEGVQHKYYVTAVDTRFAESAPAEVTG